MLQLVREEPLFRCEWRGAVRWEQLCCQEEVGRDSDPLAVGSRALLTVGLGMKAGPGVGSAVLLGGSAVTAG